MTTTTQRRPVRLTARGRAVRFCFLFIVGVVALAFALSGVAWLLSLALGIEGVPSDVPSDV